MKFKNFNKCIICKQELIFKTSYQNKICHVCYKELQSAPRCRCCGKLLIDLEHNICEYCYKNPPQWDEFFCICDYKPPLNLMIYRFKYLGEYTLANLLGQLLYKQIDSYPEVLIPVPMHWSRHLYRGYNQSNLLANYLGKHLGITVCNALKRVRYTKAQQKLTALERQTNLRNAFEIKRDINYLHVAIVDDVVTTGATVIEICNLLRSIGVIKIDVYCLCRTMKFS